MSFSAEKTWTTLANNIREIHNHDASNLSFEENYRFAYNMVLHKEGKMLYDGVNKLVAENLDALAKDRVIPTFPTGGSSDPGHQSQEGDVLLKALRSTWDDHIGNMTKLGQLLKYMVIFHSISSSPTDLLILRIVYIQKRPTSQRYLRRDLPFFLNISFVLQYEITSSPLSWIKFNLNAMDIASINPQWKVVSTFSEVSGLMKQAI